MKDSAQKDAPGAWSRAADTDRIQVAQVLTETLRRANSR